MVLTVNPVQPATSASLGTSEAGATPTLVLQPGTVVNAQVQNLLAENLVRIAIANLSIDVQTEVALTPGQNLQLAVSQTDNGIRLAVVGPGGGQSAGQGAGAASAGAAGLTLDIPVAATTGLPAVSVPSNDPLTPLQRIAVSVASESAAAQQQSLAPLFADLNAVATSNNLPPALREAVAQVLAQQTSLDSTLTGGGIEKALQKSRLFLQAALASGAAPAASAATVVSPDGRSEAGAVRTNTPPPPFRGALPSPQPVAASSIAPDAPFASLAHRLLDDTDAAIARQTLLQVASLPDRA